MKTKEDRDHKHHKHHKHHKRKFHEQYFNELIMIIIVISALIFGSLWIILVNYKVKNIEKKR